MSRGGATDRSLAGRLLGGVVSPIVESVDIAATGRTIGKAVLGLLVVGADGSQIAPRRAVLRTLLIPLSFLLFGVGLLIGLFRRDRRELHDLLAGTAVIYAWDATTARLRSVALAEVEPDGAR